MTKRELYILHSEPFRVTLHVVITHYLMNRFPHYIYVAGKAVVVWALIIIANVACSHKNGQHTEQQPAIDTMQTMVMNIKQCSRLYTSEYKVHKIITHDDQLQLKGTIMKKDFSIDIPIGERRIAIPMDATIKTYVDFSDFSDKNIRRKGKNIEIILPDPHIVITSTKINHGEIKKYVPLTRRSFSDSELSDYEQQGRASIVNAIPQMGIIDNARKSAAMTIIPLISSMGFDESNISVHFRKEFELNDIKTLLSTGSRNG